MKRRSGADDVSPQRLAVALDFLPYLAERESNEATEELLRIPGLLAAFKKAKRQTSKARAIDWRRARKHV